MRTSQEPQHNTRMIARVLGPFLVVSCLAAVVRASEVRQLVTDFDANPVWPWVTGAYIIVGGLVIVALHQQWHGFAAITVSAMGWLLTLRGLILLAFPTAFMTMANSVLESGALWRTVSVFFALIGLYLTYVGWRPAPSRPTDQARGSTPDLPRAA